MDITQSAPNCPECGGERFWYGSVELWVGGGTHRDNDNLKAAVCSNCGYSSLYLQDMPKFHKDMEAAQERKANALEKQQQKELKKGK